MKEFLIGLGLGGLLTLVVAIAMSISNHRKMLVVKAEKDKYKQMVTDGWTSRPRVCPS
jgi:esterase/lipase